VNDPSVFDLRGAGCASVLMELAAQARSDVTPDRVVVVWSDDRGAPTELPAWCRMTGHYYVGPTEQPDQYQLILHPKETP
jgi:tRNA 2-thiouridine synthesizing protein A